MSAFHAREIRYICLNIAVGDEETKKDAKGRGDMAPPPASFRLLTLASGMLTVRQDPCDLSRIGLNSDLSYHFGQAVPSTRSWLRS